MQCRPVRRLLPPADSWPWCYPQHSGVLCSAPHDCQASVSHLPRARSAPPGPCLIGWALDVRPQARQTLPTTPFEVARYIHFVATRRRCQRRIVPGVTKRCPRSIRGNLRTSAANTARSTQSRRGVGLALRSTATSRRSTRSSTSFDADERPSNNNNNRFSSHRKIKYIFLVTGIVVIYRVELLHLVCAEAKQIMVGLAVPW